MTSNNIETIYFTLKAFYISQLSGSTQSLLAKARSIMERPLTIPDNPNKDRYIFSNNFFM